MPGTYRGPVPLEPDAVIDCIDCGGQAHLISYPPELGWAPGDLVVYRCEDCLDRWDLLIPED
jgi:hypothetical protein